jgi:hypothetical protein
MEARPAEEKPTSVDRKPEAAERREVPIEDAEVMPVGEPKEIRRRDRNQRKMKKRTPEKKKNGDVLLGCLGRTTFRREQCDVDGASSVKTPPPAVT